MKGWQLGVLTAGLIVMLAVFAYVFHAPPDAPGAPPKVDMNAKGQLALVPTPTPPNQPDPNIHGNGSNFTGHDPEGKISWTLHATSILMRDAEKKAIAKDINATFFSKEQQPVAVVTCKGCTVNLANNNMQFQGRVSAVDPAGQTLTVEHLRYDGKLRRFYGHGGVRMTRANSVLIGDKVWADPNLKMVEVSGHVQAYVRTLALGTPAPSAPPTVPPLSPETPDTADTPAPGQRTGAPSASPASVISPSAIPSTSTGAATPAVGAQTPPDTSVQADFARTGAQSAMERAATEAAQ